MYSNYCRSTLQFHTPAARYPHSPEPPQCWNPLHDRGGSLAIVRLLPYIAVRFALKQPWEVVSALQPRGGFDPSPRSLCSSRALHDVLVKVSRSLHDEPISWMSRGSTASSSCIKTSRHNRGTGFSRYILKCIAKALRHGRGATSGNRVLGAIVACLRWLHGECKAGSSRGLKKKGLHWPLIDSQIIDMHILFNIHDGIG